MMKPEFFWKSVLLSVMLSAASIAPGLAADLPTQKAPPPAFSWSGFYVGFNFGYGAKGDDGVSTASGNLVDGGLAPGLWGNASALGASGFSRARLNGFFSGAQAGYNWQFAERYVVGFEADIAGAGVRGGGGLLNVTPTGVAGSSAVTSGTVDRSLEHLGTARLRFGYTVMPTLLAYATGGLAYGGVDLRSSIRQTLTPSALIAKGGKADIYDERVGFALGAGLEFALSKNLSAKLEYLYYDLGVFAPGAGRATPLVQTDILTGALTVADATAVSTRFNGHIVRAGLNYRFDGTGPDAGSASPIFAAPGLAPAASPAVGDWRVSLLPYMWAVAMNGSVTAKGKTVGVNASFIDSLTQTSSIPLAFMGRVEARNGPAFFYGDLAWMQLRFSGAALKLNTPTLDVNIGLHADARLKQTLAIGEAGAGYELARWSLGGAPDAFIAVDAYGGLRYWFLGVDLDLDVLGAIDSQLLDVQQVGAKAISKSGNIQWIDPVIGGRVRYQTGPGEEFQFRADIGGFGVGSKLGWQAYGGYSRDFQFAGLNLTSVLGYRAVSVDYAAGSGVTARGLNAIVHGPVTGMALRF
jgi:opacity protein-like surface antigen